MNDRRTIEARTVRNVAELRAFLDAAMSAVNCQETDADLINLGSPVDFRLVEITLTDGSIVLDLETSPWKG